MKSVILRKTLVRAAAFVLLIFLLAPDGGAFASNPMESVVREQAERISSGEIEAQWNKLMKEYGSYFSGNGPPSVAEMIMNGSDRFSLAAVAGALLKFLLHEVLVNGKLLASIVLLTVFSMILETVQSAFERNTVSKIAYSICYMVLLLIAVNSFSVAVGYAKSAISGMIDFMIAMVPVMLTILAAMGNITTVAVMHPLIVFMIHTVGTFIYTVVFPLLFFSAVLHIVSSLSDKYKVTQLANLLRSVSVTALGIIMAVFLGVISVRGWTGAAADGLTIRTAKYITGNFIPVVGKMFSDAADTVAGASLLVKNTVGLAGVVIIVLLCLFPAIKIITLAMIYNFAAAVMQPLGGNPIIGCLQTIGKSLIYVFAAVASVGLMFFLAVTIIIAAGNVSVMMR